jgi:hypothetical protein
MQVIKKETSFGEVIELIAEEGMKIINKERNLVFKRGFIPFGKTEDDYEEVGYEVWGCLESNEIPKNKLEELEQNFNSFKEEIVNLETIALETDYRLMEIEIEKEFGEELFL